MAKKSHAAAAAPKAVPALRYSVMVRIGGDIITLGPIDADTGDEAAAKGLAVADDPRATVCGVHPYSS